MAEETVQNYRVSLGSEFSRHPNGCHENSDPENADPENPDPENIVVHCLIESTVISDFDLRYQAPRIRFSK